MAMQVEVLTADNEEAVKWTLEFDALPRVGDYLALDAGDYFSHYNVIEVWHRQDPSGAMRACISVELDD